MIVAIDMSQKPVKRYCRGILSRYMWRISYNTYFWPNSNIKEDLVAELIEYYDPSICLSIYWKSKKENFGYRHLQIIGDGMSSSWSRNGQYIYDRSDEDC